METYDQNQNDMEEKTLRNELIKGFGEAEYVMDWDKMQDVIERARAVEYLNLAQELQDRYDAAYSNPSKNFDYSNENF